MKGLASLPFRPRFVSTLLFCASLAASGLAFAAPPQIQETAARQMVALRTIKAAKTPTQNKIDSRLYLSLLHQRGDSRLNLLTEFRFAKPEADGLFPVEILLSGPEGMKPVLNLLEQNGAKVTAKSLAFRHVTARVHLTDLDALAAIPSVRKVRTEIPHKTNKVNTSQGDATHGADVARSYYGTTGAGVKVCVLSDGVDSLAALQASGDLPATVDVLTGQEGSGDEGSAMLEIVHDLAPGAALGFAQAGPDEAGFAQNILDLAAAGCNVIVDDVIYLDESPFEDGPVAQSVNTVTTAGVMYFSSAGNEGNKADGTSGTWEGDFAASAAADPAPLAGANLHDFGDGGNSILIEVGGGNPPILIWAEHFDATTGTASTDYDLYDMSGDLATIFDASTDVQDGAGGDDFPIEFIGGGVFSGERLLIDKFAAGTTSSVPMFNLIVFRGELDDALATTGATRGHSAAANALSVAATPAAASFDGVTPDGPYPGLFTGANESESFSSDGPRRIILNTDGSEITPDNRTSTGGTTRQKPEITAADGVSTAAPGFDPFYGTSAAAPHAAAIAALIKSALPTQTPAQVRAAMIATAIDIEGTGTDITTGAGIVMPGAALESLGAVAQAFLTAGTAVPTQQIGDGDAYVEANEIFNLNVPLTNVGGDDATGITAVLSTTTPGVTINQANSAYADLAPTASGNNLTPYNFTVGSAVPCGSVIDFALTVTYTNGSSPQTFNFSIATGSPGTPVAFSYTGPAVPIPDGVDLTGGAPGAVVSVDLPVALSGSVYAITASIDGATCDAVAGSTTVGIDHSFVNDLEIALHSPAGTTVKVIDNTDGGGNNLCQTVLSDAGATSIQSVVTANAPFTGTFSPANPLSTFRGEASNGTWQLQAQDFFAQDTGNVRAFTLNITPAVCDAPPLVSNVTGTKTVSGNTSVGGTVTYTITLTNSGGGAAADNPGNEFTDVLPASLTLVSATATSGTAVATVGTNTVTWNGSLAPLTGSVTITITATVGGAVADGTPISNQGTINYDSDGNGTNDATRTTDDPGVGGSNDATVFQAAAGLLVVTPATTDFGTVAVGSVGGPFPVTYSNVGSGTLHITGATAVLPPFAIVAGGTCPATFPITLIGGAGCTINYTFNPTATGTFSQTFTVTSDSPGSGATYELTGQSGQGNLVITAPASFGNVQVGSTSGVVTATLTNTGTAALTATVSPESTPFTRTAGGTCPAGPIVLAASANCTIAYTFAPTTTGLQSQVITVTTTAPGSGNFSLSGTGVQGTLALSAASLDFNTISVGSSTPRTLTITNTGTGSLDVTAISAAAAPFSVTGGTCPAPTFTLAAGGSCTITYTFAPTAAGTFNQPITVTSSAGNATVTLTGVAVVQVFTAQPIPTLSDLGRLLMLLGLGGLGAYTVRRRLQR